MDDQNNNVLPPVPEAAPEAPVTPVTPAPALPDDTRDRTREQFNKLIDSNSRLNDTNAALLAENLATKRELDALRAAKAQQAAPAPQPQPATAAATINPNDFVERDPITGEAFINEQKLKAEIDRANAKALENDKRINDYISAQEKREMEREAERQNREAYSVYPELEPGTDKFNPDFNKQVRGILQDSMWNMDEYGGRPLSFKEAADYVRKISPVAPATPVVDPAVQEQKSQEAQALKEQSSAQPAAQPGNNARQDASAGEELERLRYRTRYLDDNDALAERIKHTEHILGPDAKLI